MNSKFLKINLEELIKGLIVVVIGSILTALLQVLQTKGFSFTQDDLLNILVGGTIAGLSYLTKTLLQDEEGNQLGGILRIKK